MNRNLHEYSFVIEESKVHIKCDNKEAVKAAIKEIKRHREHLVEYINKNPSFRYALKPIASSSKSKTPKIVQLMTEASRAANVGPMASVAGALADIGLECMRRKGCLLYTSPSPRD